MSRAGTILQAKISQGWTVAAYREPDKARGKPMKRMPSQRPVTPRATFRMGAVVVVLPGKNLPKASLAMPAESQADRITTDFTDRPRAPRSRLSMACGVRITIQRGPSRNEKPSPVQAGDSVVPEQSRLLVLEPGEPVADVLPELPAGEGYE